jgi:3-oxoacyl-[acyl-carrier protein] reductase
MTREDIDRTVRGTLLGPMYCTKAALGYMVPQGSGRVINIGSGSALAASPGFAVYGTAKAGVNTFTNFVAHEVAKHGIQVLGVNAGMMWGQGRPPLEPDTVPSLIPRLRTAIQRYSLPEEVANMVAFLASDAASCMTGTMVDMTGGRV